MAGGPTTTEERRSEAALRRVQTPTEPDTAVHVDRRLALFVLLVVLAVGVLLLAVFPGGNYLDQRAENRRAAAELAEVKAERRRVRAELDRLNDPEEIERRARQDEGFVQPGEQSFREVPRSIDPLGLPPGWPFDGVALALGAR